MSFSDRSSSLVTQPKIMPDGSVEYGQDILLTWDLPIFVKMLNPNKVRLFEGSFSGVGGWGEWGRERGGRFDPPLHISRRTNLVSINIIQLLNNLFTYLR